MTSSFPGSQAVEGHPPVEGLSYHVTFPNSGRSFLTSVTWDLLTGNNKDLIWDLLHVKACALPVIMASFQSTKQPWTKWPIWLRTVYLNGSSSPGSQAEKGRKMTRTEPGTIFSQPLFSISSCCPSVVCTEEVFKSWMQIKPIQCCSSSRYTNMAPISFKNLKIKKKSNNVQYHWNLCQVLRINIC